MLRTAEQRACFFLVVAMTLISAGTYFAGGAPALLVFIATITIVAFFVLAAN